MKDISFTLAMKSLKKEYKKYVFFCISTIIAFASIILVTNSLYINSNISKKKNALIYGDWKVVTYDEKQDVLDIYRDLKFTYTDLTGDGNVYNLNENYNQLMNVHLLKGRLPLNNHEIITDGSYSLGSTLGEYKVVGIINNYDEKWCVDAPHLFSVDVPKQHHISFLNHSGDFYEVEKLLGHKGNIYNISLYPEFSYYRANIENDYYEDDLGEHQMYSFQVNDVEYNKTNHDVINSVIIASMLGVVMFIASVFGNREKDILTIRMLGMTRRQQRRYFFYEILVVTVVGLLAGIVIGVLGSLLISCLLYSKTSILIVDYPLGEIVKNVGFVLLIILGYTCFALLMFDLRYFNSLIKRKNRTQLKKYSKAKRITVTELAKREWAAHNGIANAALLSIFCIFLALTVCEFRKENKENSALDHTYTYTIQSSESIDFTDVSYESLERMQQYEYSSFEGKEGEYLGNIIKKFPNVDYQLAVGRLPKNNREVILYTNDESNCERFLNQDVVISYYNNDDIDDEGNAKYEYRNVKIVGITMQGDYYFDQKWTYLNSLIVEDNYPFKAPVLYYTKITSKKDLLHIIETKTKHRGSIEYDIYTKNDNDYTSGVYVYLVTLAVVLVMLVAFLQDYFKTINDDLRMVRCLGLSHKQLKKVNIIISLSIMIMAVINYSIAYIYVYRLSWKPENIMEIGGYWDIRCLIIPMVLFMIYMIYNYQKNVKEEFTFLPTDVIRE